MSEKDCEIFIESDKSSFDSGISTTDKDINIKKENEKINYNEILENLNTQKIFYDELRKRLSQLTDRRAKKKKFELCNICFAQLDTEDIKTCTPCCQCEKSVCRGKNCSYWLPKLAKWECQLCNLSNASQSRTKEWINKQVKTENEIYHPIRARSELNIPILDDKLSATQSLNYIPTCSTTSSTTGLNLHKEKIRNHVEEILADMLGGSLDNISVGPMSKNKQYYNLFNKYHTHLSEKLRMLENTIQQLNINKSHYNYHNINKNHNHHQCNHHYNNFNNGNYCQSLPYKDLPLWESNSTNNLDTNNPTNISHFKLKRLIERIVEETLRIPQLTDFSGVPPHLSSSDNHLQLQHHDRRHQRHRSSSRRNSKLSNTDDYDNYNEIMYGNNPQYFDPKRYQELLATAVLNKIVDTCATEKKLIDPNKIRNIDNNHNKIIITKELCDVSSSSSSHDPRSDSSLPDPIQDENVEDINVRLYADILNENFDRESILSDSLSTHKNIPEIISSDNDSIEDFVSVASGADSTWEENWLFKKRKLATHPVGPIGMLVPAPREDIKTMIGDKSADEISDFSENEDDGYGNYNRNDSGPENDRIQNKIVIGGQNTVGLFDELMEQTSLISKCSSSADNESYIETTNDYVGFKYGLNVKEEPSLDLTYGGVPIKTEAINAAIGVHLLKSEEPIAENESETNNNIEVTEPLIYTQPSNIDSEVPESNQQERNENPNGNQQQRRRSTIEFLAAIALGPVLTVCSPDINEDVLKTITNKTDVVSLLTQSENINIEIEEEQYFDIEVHNRPDIPCSPSIEATESGISTPNFKQNNSGYVTPESGISTPNLKQSRSGTPTNSGKVSPTSKQVRFNENPTVIKKRKRNRTIYDTELNESLIANVFIDHIIRAAENKNVENTNEEETIENNIFDNNNLSDCIENVPSSKEEECTFILPSDVLTQISSLLSDIDLGSLKDDLIRSVSPIPFDNNLDIFICPPPPNFDIDVSASGTPIACDINLENKNIINSENIIQEKSVPITETEPITTENLTNCNTAETIVVDQAEQFDHSKPSATSTRAITPEIQPLETLEKEKHIEDDLTALTESESVTAETSITLHENNKDIEETRTAAESSESETIANTATAITENEEQNGENGKLMEENSDLVEKIEKPVAESMEHSQPVQDTPKADVETKISASQSVENNKPVNDTLTAIVETEPSTQEKNLEKNQLITETKNTVAETEILLLEETTPSAVKPLESKKPVENTAVTDVETEILVTVPIDNTELKEETLSTIPETQQQETEPLENNKSVQDIQTEIVTTETISGALLENNKLINETLTAVTEIEQLTTDSSENSKPVENTSTEGQAIEPLVIKPVQLFENNETIQEISTVTLGIESLSTKTLEGSSEENTAAPALENKTPSSIQVVENNTLIAETFTEVSKTELLPKESSESNNSIENSSTAVVGTEALDIDPAANSKISPEISIADAVKQPIRTEQVNNNNSLKNEAIRVVEIKPSDEKFSEGSKSEENIANSEIETQIADSLEYSKFVEGALTAFASAEFETEKSLANSKTVELKQTPTVETNSEIETQFADSLEYSKLVQGALTAFASTEFETTESLANSKTVELKQTPIVETTPLSKDLLENNNVIEKTFSAVSKTELLIKECSESYNVVDLASIVLEIEAPVSDTLANSNIIQEILTTNAENRSPATESLVSNNSIEKEITSVKEINTSAADTCEHSKPVKNSTTSTVEIESPAQKPLEKKKTVEDSTSEVVKILDDSILEPLETVTAVAETEQFTEESLEISKSVSPALAVLKNKAKVIELLENNNITEEKLTAIKETEIPVVELLKSENTSTSILETESIAHESLKKSTAVEEMPSAVEQTVDDLTHDSLENTIHIQQTSTAVLETNIPTESATLENSKSAEDTSTEVAKSVGDLVSKPLENVAKSNTESIENSKPIEDRTTSDAAITESEEQNGANGKLIEEKRDRVEETEKTVAESLEHSQLVQDTPMTEVESKPSATQSVENNKTVNDTLTAIVETEPPAQEKNLEKNQLITETTITIAETEILSPEESPPSAVQPFESNSPVENTTIASVENEIEEDRTTMVATTENELSTTTTLENNNLIEKISSKVEETQQIGATSVVKVEEQIAPSTVVSDVLELVQNNKQNTSTPVTETQPLAIETVENNKPNNNTSIQITKTDLTGTEPGKIIEIIDEGTAPPTTEIQQIEKPVKETPSANMEIESLSEGASQINNPVYDTPTEIAETKPSTAELDCKNIVEESSTAITEPSSTITKLSEVVELDDSFHIEMILPPPVEFQNITNDESPTSLNLLEEIEPISEILEAVKDTEPEVVKHVTEVSPTTTAAELENTNLKNEALTDVIESEPTAIETLVITNSVENEQTIVLENETVTKDFVTAEPLLPESEPQITKSLQSLENIEPPKDVPETPIIVKEPESRTIQTVENTELSEDTQTSAAERETESDNSQFIEESLTIVKDTEAPGKERLEINRSMEEKMSETKSLAEQSLDIPDVPKDTLNEVIKSEFTATTEISSSIKNEPPTEQILGNNNTLNDTSTVETYPQVESEKVAEIKPAVVNSIAVLDNKIDISVGLSEDKPTETAKIEPPAIEVLEKNKLIEETLTGIGNNEAPDTKLIEPSNPVEETASNIAEAEPPATQPIANLEPPKVTSTVVIESEPAVEEPLAISSSVQQEPPAVVENEAQTSKTNNTVKKSPTIEANPQVESSEIVAEVEQTAVPLIAVEDKILETEPDVGLSEEIPTAIERSDQDIEAPAAELSAISTSMEQTIPFIVERETPATQLLENSELLKDSQTDIIESEPTITKSVSISANNEPTDVIENKTPDKELLENNVTVNEIPNVETYPQVESVDIVEELQNTVLGTNVGLSENKLTAAVEEETLASDTMEKNKCKQEISTAVKDIEAPAKVSLVINKSVEETTPIIVKPESLTTQATENSEAPKEIPTDVIESKPIESTVTQLLENPEPPKNSPTDIIESESAIIKSISISVGNETMVVIENETLIKEHLENKNTISIDKQVELPEIVAETGSKDVESTALPDEKLDTSVNIIDSNPAEDMTTETAKLESPTSEVEEVYTTPPESLKSIPVEYAEVSRTPESKKTLKDTTNSLTEPKPVISELSENSKSIEHSKSVSSLETQLEITKPLDSQSVEHTAITTEKTIPDSTENNECAESSSEAVATGEPSILEPSDNSNPILETVTTAAKIEPKILETRPAPEIAENKQVVMESTAILKKNLNTIKQVEKKLSSGETEATDTVPTVSESSKDIKLLETTKNAAAETESAVLQPDAITENKLETTETDELPTNLSLNEIIIVNEQTVTNTISDVDLSKEIKTADSIDEIIITLPTAIENHIIDSDIENIELTDLIIPPPFDFASEDNSETTQNDESIQIQASHNTTQIELINDFVENNSKILDTEITVINNNITTSSTNSETILSNDLAKDSDKNLENNLKLSGSSINSPTKAICDKESIQTVLETGHNTNNIVEEISINKEGVLTEISDENQSTQISILTESASKTENSNLPTNSENKNPPNTTTLEETNNPDATIQDKTTEVPSSSPYDTTELSDVKLQSIANTTLSSTIINSNLGTSLKNSSGNSTNLETKENEVTSENENSLNTTDKSNKTDEMQQIETTPKTLVAIKSFENTETPEAPTENLTSEEISNEDLVNPPLDNPIIETQNIDKISLDQQIITTVSNSIFESNETESTDIKIEDNATSSANQTAIKELKSERTSSDSTDESTHTILDATEEAQTITPTDENLINQSSIRPNLIGNENKIPREDSKTNTLIKTSTTTDTDDIVMLHDENILNMENNDSNLTDNKLINVVINNDNDVQNLTNNDNNVQNLINNDNDVQNLTNNDNNVQNLLNILENTNNTNIIDNTNNNNINTNLNSETNFINEIVIPSPSSETNFINKIVYLGVGNNDIENNNNDVQNEIINELISENIEPILVTNTNNITPKLVDTKNTEAFCKTLDISDEDDEQNNNNLIPGSIAEREHKKWYNAVEMPNNPYAPEALLRRLDSRQEVLLDIPRHVTNTEISSPAEEEEDEEIITAVKLNPKKIDLSIYSRDYYVPTTTTTKTNSSKNKLIKMSCIENDQQLQQQEQQSQQILNDNKELLNEEQKPISDEIVQIINTNEQSNEQPQNDTTCDNKLNLNSNSEIDNENIFSAKLIQITDDEPTKSLLELSIQSASDKLKTDSSPSDISLANSLTLSEDSDTLRVYNLNKQETTFILKENQQQQQQPQLLQQQLQQLQLTDTSSTDRYFNDITNTPPNTPITPIIPKILPRAPRIRPTELKLQQQTSSQSPTQTGSGGSGSGNGSGKTAMVLTPQSFKFLHPKRKIIEPSQILTQEQYTTPPETPDKIVIEEEIVHTLPSVKALAKAFLLTQGKLSDVHNSNVRPKSLIVETTSDKFETKDQIIKTISHENLATPIEKVSNDTIKQDENQNNITISERPLSPVLLTTGKLKDNIAFFENLKKN